jgi:hypothetical protein
MAPGPSGALSLAYTVDLAAALGSGSPGGLRCAEPVLDETDMLYAVACRTVNGRCWVVGLQVCEGGLLRIEHGGASHPASAPIFVCSQTLHPSRPLPSRLPPSPAPTRR